MSAMEVETADANSGTGAGMIAFLDAVIRKNEMVEATGSALRTGCKKVLEVDEGWQSLDMRTLDQEALVARFRNKNRTELRERSIYNYEQRFRQTVEMYLKWLDNDPTWKPRARGVANANGSPKKVVAAKRGASAPESGTAAAPAMAAMTGEAGMTVGGSAPATSGATMVAYPLPIRPGVQGRLVLPEDLTKKEAQRVVNFVNALAFDERLAITAGSPDEDER